MPSDGGKCKRSALRIKRRPFYPDMALQGFPSFQPARLARVPACSACVVSIMSPKSELGKPACSPRAGLHSLFCLFCSWVTFRRETKSRMSEQFLQKGMCKGHGKEFQPSLSLFLLFSSLKVGLSHAGFFIDVKESGSRLHNTLCQ